MHRPDDLRELTEGFLAELPFADELGRLEEALRYSLLGEIGRASCGKECCSQCRCRWWAYH